MKKILIITYLSFLGYPLFACTNILVSRGASADSSVMISYSADSHTLYGELYYWPAANHPAGSMLDVYEWDTHADNIRYHKFLGRIPQVPHTYHVTGNINEHQLSIGETTFTGRPELQDTTGIIDYGSLIYITLQRAKTAREAIHTIDKLLTTYGYYSTGESFSIADKNEVWIMELIGKGPGNKGAVWVALRIPDGYISAHANQSRITTFPQNDPENCLYSKDVINFARQKKYFTGKDSEFNFSAAYAPADYQSLRFCEGRVYSIFNRAAPSQSLSMAYVKGESATPMPLWIMPDQKLTVTGVMNLMRDHFQGTEWDMTTDIGAGPNSLPYRWRPLTWTIDSVEYCNERAISTQQTGFSFVSQLRNYLPNPIGGILWFGLDDTYSTVYMPIYCAIASVPEPVRQGNGDMLTYSPTSAFWIFNQVANFAYLRYNLMIKDIQHTQNQLESGFVAQQANIEAQAVRLYSDNPVKAIELLTQYSDKAVETTMSTWQTLFTQLLVSYLDGNYKTSDGKLSFPGYPESYYRMVIEHSGDKFRLPSVR